MIRDSPRYFVSSANKRLAKVHRQNGSAMVILVGNIFAINYLYIFICCYLIFIQFPPLCFVPKTDEVHRVQFVCCWMNVAAIKNPSSATIEWGSKCMCASWCWTRNKNHLYIDTTWLNLLVVLRLCDTNEIHPRPNSRHTDCATNKHTATKITNLYNKLHWHNHACTVRCVYWDIPFRGFMISVQRNATHKIL